MKTKTNTVLAVVAFLAYWIGLCNASAFYDPGTQRWLNRDPIDEDGGINLYRFVNNSPLGRFDPYGLQCPIGTFLSAQPPVIPRPLIEQAIELNRASLGVQPRPRVNLPDGRAVDLFGVRGGGKGHLDKATGERVRFPQVHDPKPANPAPYQNFKPGLQDVPRDATLGDILDTIIHLKGSLGGAGCSNCDQNAPPSQIKGPSQPSDKAESPLPKPVPVIPFNQFTKYCPMA